MPLKGQETHLELVHCPGHEAKHSPFNAPIRFVSDRAPSEGQFPSACHGSLTTNGEGKSSSRDLTWPTDVQSAFPFIAALSTAAVTSCRGGLRL